MTLYWKTAITLVIAASLSLTASEIAPQPQIATTDSLNRDSCYLEPMVVTATTVSSPLKTTASSISVITTNDIAQKQAATVAEALNDVSGLFVTSSGGIGQKSSIFIRGANSEQVLVLLDGVILNNPILTGHQFDFSSLTTDNVDRIEVLKGPQSTLYGSDAIGGVINIISKKGSAQPSGYASMEAGAFSTFKENAGCSNTGKYVGYSLSMSQVQSKGISAASARYGNIEPDGCANTALDGNVSVYPVCWLKLGLNARYNLAKTDIDNWGGIGGDDPNNIINAEDVYVRGYAHIALLENKAWVQDIGYAYTKQDQKNNNDIDSAHPAEYMRSSFHANTWKTDWKHTITLLPLQTIVAGVDIHHEEGSSLYYSISSYGPYSSVIGKKIMDIYSGYIQDVFSLNDRLYLTYGVRLDNNSKFNTKLTGRATAAYYQKDLCNGLDVKLKGTAGTGFKAPSLYQLYSEYGDTMLNPENSIGYDGGFEISGHNGSIHLNVVVFYNKYTDMIDYNTSTFMYANISSAESKGIETELSAKPIDCIDCAVHYTFTKTRNLETNEELLQRPQHTWGFDCGYHPYKGIFLNGNVQYVGKRFDYGYITMPSYTLLNLRASLDLNSHITLYGRIENLLDKQYEVTYGYGTPGRSAYGGVKVAF